MYSLIILAFASFLLSLLLTPLVRNLFRRWGMLDSPDKRRKLHENPIPRVGGVAIVLAYLLSYLLLLALGTNAATGLVSDSLYFALLLLPALAVIFATGLFDDLRGLKPWQKLAGQIAAAILAYAAGVHFNGIHGYVFSPWLSFPITILWLIACANAVNLIDGVDGLAAGVGFFATCTTLLAALLQNNAALALATIPLAGALLGFLRFNFNPASIFLGDSGSLTIGFLLGCSGILWSQKATTILGMTAPLMALSIPLLDTGLAVARRFLRNQPIFVGDRGHIHHRLLDRGFTPRKVALILYAVCALSAMASLATTKDTLSGYVVIVFCIVTWIGIQHLGYVEFGTAGRMFLEGAFRRVLNSQLELQSCETALAAATTPEDCWAVLEKAVRQFGFHRARMQLAGRSFLYSDAIQPVSSWEVRIPISGQDYIELTRAFGDHNHHSLIAPFADTLHRVLTPKLPAFAALPPDPAQPECAVSQL